MMKLGIPIDASTTALIAAARATQASEGLPKDSARTLVAAARACRLYLEAQQPKLAFRQLDEIETLMADCEDTLLVEAYDSLITRVRKALGFAHPEIVKEEEDAA